MENRDLPCLFGQLLQSWKQLDASMDEGDVEVVESVNLCLEVSSRVESLSLFSTNEEIDEVTTTSLRYMLIKYLEAGFRLKPHEKAPQMNSLKHIMGCFLQFLKLLNDYGMKSKSTSGDPRSGKIERYKKEKKLKDQMSQYEKENPDGSNDEEAERAYWLNFIQFAETDSSSQLEMLRREAEMLKMRDRGVEPEPPRQPPQSSQPIIVARDEQMKQVFGLGYPSRPVYTVEEFGDRQVELMKKQQQDEAKWKAENPPPDPYKELTEEEEEEERKKAQRWDIHKDYTRRGDGNRKNMG